MAGENDRGVRATSVGTHTDEGDGEDHFRPTGTMTVLALFVATLILLWLSVYLILIARGVTT